MSASILKKLSIATFGAVATIGVFASASNAASITLGKYDFEYANGTTLTSTPNNSTGINNVNYNYPADTNFTAPNVTLSNFTASSSIYPNLNNAGNAVIANGLDTGNPSTGKAPSYTGWTISTTAPYDPTKYYSFIISPQSGYSLNLSDISIDDRRSGSGPTMREVRSSLDNFATAIPSSVITISSGSATVNNSFTTNPVTLDPSQFTSLTSPVEFRLYGYDAMGTGTGGTWRVDNVTVDGSVQGVPEPLTMSGCGTALVLGGILKRKFKSKKRSLAC